ncbi:hypothetical protein [Terrabacter aeriphilus]|uniref:hypothetical protein n=1 Tax=Terrabacter aeriphilus TaxID=515662 RepID=UPI0031EE1D0A
MQIIAMTHRTNRKAPPPKTIGGHRDSEVSDEDQAFPTVPFPSLASASGVRRLPVTCPRRIEAGMLRQRASALP